MPLVHSTRTEPPIFIKANEPRVAQISIRKSGANSSGARKERRQPREQLTRFRKRVPPRHPRSSDFANHLNQFEFRMWETRLAVGRPGAVSSIRAKIKTRFAPDCANSRLKLYLLRCCHKSCDYRNYNKPQQNK